MDHSDHLTANGTGFRTLVAPEPLDQAPRRILVVDDNFTICRQLKGVLQRDAALQIDTFTDTSKALHEITANVPSLVIAELRMRQLDGMQLLREIMQKRLPVTVILTSGDASVDEALEAMRLGAYDFLTKPFDNDHVWSVIERALRERALRDEVISVREQLQTKYAFQNIISKNTHMHEAFELITRVADTNTTVLIEGETGTGKEEIARAVHAASQNRNGPFVAVNCAALPEALVESELFGHEKGSFTSAVGQRRGRFELANGGTIFFDEIGDIPATVQAKLLRALQERSVERVGGSEQIHVDVRVIAATNRPLQRMVKANKFREDLYYRLNVVRIELPPLRERPEDIPLLAAHFTEKYARPGGPVKQFSPEAMELLVTYGWPGNIRELENAVERACVTSRDRLIQVENLPPELHLPRRKATPFSIDLATPLTELIQDAVSHIERQYIRQALRKTRGHVGQCARICGLSRRSITTKIAEHKLDKAMFKNN
jgi:DNA-binding NtrC family response regulator